jgi:hypothetical protein
LSWLTRGAWADAGSQRSRLNRAVGQQVVPDDAQLAQYIGLAVAPFGQRQPFRRVVVCSASTGPVRVGDRQMHGRFLMPACSGTRRATGTDRAQPVDRGSGRLVTVMGERGPASRPVREGAFPFPHRRHWLTSASPHAPSPLRPPGCRHRDRSRRRRERDHCACIATRSRGPRCRRRLPDRPTSRRGPRS